MAPFEADYLIGNASEVRNSTMPDECGHHDELPIVVLGAGMAGLQFACSLAKYSGQSCPIIVAESFDRPGGKALGIWDDVAQEYDASLQYFASSVSHHQVIKRAKEVGVDFTDGPPMFSFTRATTDYYETAQPGPSRAELEAGRMEVALHRAGYIDKPCLKDAIQFYRKHGVDFASELDFTPKVTDALSVLRATNQFLRVGGYHHLPPTARMMKTAYDFESCRVLLPGKTESLAMGLASDAAAQGVKFEFSTTVVGIEFSETGVVQAVSVESSCGERKRIACKAIVNTLPVRTFTSLLRQQGRIDDEEGCDSGVAQTKCLQLLSKASFHLYRGWIVEVEKSRPDLHLVLDWGSDTADNNAVGRVVGMGNSTKTASAVGCLQIGQVTSAESLEPDLPDEFYLEKVRDACRRAGLGAVTRVRGKGVWSMAPYLGKDNAIAMETLQGDSQIFHCSDYMFPSSMSHSMCYAARLAKRVATLQGYCPEHCAPSLYSKLHGALHDFREWSSFEASVTRDRQILDNPSNDSGKNSKPRAVFEFLLSLSL